MSAIFWYYGVAAVGLALTAYTVYRKRTIPELAAFFCTATVFSYFFELIVLALLKSYDYKPGVFADPAAESTLGHIITNTFLWGGTAIAVAALSLSFGWILLIAISYMLTEVLFIRLGIYEQYWWRTWMTGVGCIIFFEIVKLWYAKMFEHRQGLLRFLTFHQVSVFMIQVPTVVIVLAGKFDVSLTVLDRRVMNTVAVAYAYYSVELLVCTFFLLIARRWYWKLAPIIILALSDIAFHALGIVNFHDGWSLLDTILLKAAGWALVALLELHAWRDPVRRPPDEWIPPACPERT